MPRIILIMADREMVKMSCIVKLKEQEADTSVLGGKASNLCLLKLSGFNVPEGIVVTTLAYNQFIKHNNLEEKIGSLLRNIDYESMESIIKNSGKIGELILNAVVPQKIAEQIQKEISKANMHNMAVRSSATTEDLTNASFAGIYNSYLNTTPCEVIERIRDCWASLYNPEAVFYRNHHKISGKPRMAVLIQEMIETDFAGVTFTKDPLDNKRVCIELVKGPCDALVSGETTPERHYFERSSLGMIKSEETREFSGSSRLPLRELAVISIEIEKSLGCPQDIEWGINNKTIYLLQSRPITTISGG